MSKKLYAHSKDGQPREDWQKLEVHLKNVAQKAYDFSKDFCSSDWAWNAGRLHDLGKAADEFQAYLLRENGLDDRGYDGIGTRKINHSSAGAAFAMEVFGPQVGLVYAYLVSGHHAGLPDFYSSETGRAALPFRLDEGKKNLSNIRQEADKIGKKLCREVQLPPFVKPDHFHLWIRMLFSCIVDADFLDTEEFMAPGKKLARGRYPKLSHLKTTFDVHMAKLTSNAPDTPVNQERKNILSSCRTAAGNPQGLFSLSVPTGGGKTLSGMAFALDHAVIHKKKRIIYVIPYTSIIEQTAKILSDIFGPDNIVEHHSNLDPEKETQRSRLASENWDAPVIITTNVQFFESLYAAKPGRCRKLHNIVNSVVILDEAQLLPPGLLDPCVNVINHLTRDYKVSMVLSTATQPALPGIDPPFNIISNPSKLYKQLKRTKTIFPKDMKTPSTWKDIARDLTCHKQVLCVVNTRKDCFDLFQLMPQGTIHLSALMCGEHRSKVIEKIKKALQKGLPIRVISTQLVEAGVDIDFPVVYRALSGLDSVAQSGGRCNREGTLNTVGKLGRVVVFIPPKHSPGGLLRKGEDTTRELIHTGKINLDHPDIFDRYFSLFYGKVNDTGDKFKDWLIKDAPDLHVQFRTAAKAFNLIEQTSRPLFVTYGNSGKFLEELRHIGPTRENMRKLQRYSVNVSKTDFEKIKHQGLIDEVWPEFWAWLGPYSNSHGLDIFGQGWAPEDLIS